MARYAYDVNTTQRYIDVHKQFQGGLKTVDTDDSLGAVFLRDAENVSLSEFGFIEKRYGTYEKFRASVDVTAQSNLQLYWEFLGKYIIVAVDGRIYYQDIETPESNFNEFLQFNTLSTLTYPEGIASFLGLESDLSAGSGFSGFQSDRPMGAVNIANVLYVFTGKYPIYIVEEENNLKAYLFAKDDPIYAEIFVTGHNLLESDYESLYYTSKKPIDLPGETSEVPVKIKDANFTPKIPFANEGTIDFELTYDIQSELKNPFVFDAVNPEFSTLLREVSLKNVQYRPSGPGATDLSFVNVDANLVSFQGLSNVLEAPENINANDFDAFDNPSFVEVSLDSEEDTLISQEQEVEVPINYWASENRYFPSLLNSSNGRRARLKSEESNQNFLKIKYKDVKVDVHISNDSAYLSEDEITANARIGFKINDLAKNPVLFEENNTKVRALLSNYLSTDPRIKKLTPKVSRTGYASGYNAQIVYTLYYQTLQADTGTVFIPGITDSPNNSNIAIFSVRVPMTTTETVNYPSGVGNATLTYEFTGTSRDFINVTLTRPDGSHLITTTVDYKDLNNQEQALKYSDITKSLPLTTQQRDALLNVLRKPTTTVELHRHDSSSGHDDDIIKIYRLGDGLEYDEGLYYIDIPSDVSTGNHYEIVFKTTHLGADIFATDGFGQSDYLDQENESSVFLTQLYEPTSFNSDVNKYFYPPLFSFTRLDGDLNLYSFEPLSDFSYTLFSVENIVNLSYIGNAIGSSFLKPSILGGLLSGTYDFKFTFTLETDSISEDLSKVSQSLYDFSYIVKDITVTEEKLTDFKFFEGERNRPIWSCNRVIEHFNKLMVWGSTEMPNSVFYSFPDRPFYFPSKFYLDFTNENNEPITSVVPYMNILVVQSEEHTWGIRGTSGFIEAPSPYIPFSINSTIGTIAPGSVRAIRNKLFFLSKQGVVAINSLYAVDESYNIDFMDRNIRNIVPQDSDAVGIQFDNQYWLNFPNYGITLRWYIDKKAWVLDRYGSWNNFKGILKYQIKNGNLEFITYPSRFEESGSFSIYKVGIDYGLTHDLSGVIVARFETSYLNQNYPFHPKNYKETKLDFTLQNEYNQSKEAVYTMETNEHISESSLHTIDNLAVVPNHFYKVVYNFEVLDYPTFDGGGFTTNVSTDVLDGGNFSNNEYESVGGIIFRVIVIADGGTFSQAPSNIYDGGDFNANSYEVIGDLSFFNIPNDINQSFDHLRLNDIMVKEFDSDTLYNVKALTIGDNYAEFMLPYQVKGDKIDVFVQGEFQNYFAGAEIYDTTYDDKLTFKTWVISEEQTLNLDNIDSYDQAKADLDIDFNNRLGTWVFGTSDFGNKITAVKTIKLSGRGYNSKIYMEDYSKSKWTLESLGITYKMKRARSR